MNKANQMLGKLVIAAIVALGFIVSIAGGLSGNKGAVFMAASDKSGGDTPV
jgi:hypothetical protein